MEETMIHNDDDYRKAMAVNEEERRRIDGLVDVWKKQGLTDDEIKRLSDPMMCFHLQFVEEAKAWRKEQKKSRMANRDDMLSKATRFDMGLFKESEVTVEVRRFENTTRWAVLCGSSVLNADSKWEYEPMPSSRDDDFIARTRFDFDDAWSLAEAVVRDAAKEKNDG